MPVIKSIHINNSDYQKVYEFMQNYTATRTAEDFDYIITTEHKPIYTMGPNSDSSDIISKADNIPYFKTNRGGKITFHGPGQLVIYTLLDLKRLGIKVHELIDTFEYSMLDFLKSIDLQGNLDPNNRGIYINNDKIASLGIRVSRGCTYHGIAINVNTDLNNFSKINPCGLSNIKMQNLQAFSQLSINKVKMLYLKIFIKRIETIIGQPIDICTYSDKILKRMS